MNLLPPEVRDALRRAAAVRDAAERARAIRAVIRSARILFPDRFQPRKDSNDH